MTTRGMLHCFVDQLSDDDARVALALLQSQLAESETSELPEFFGILDSDETDLAARSSEILRAEFGRS